MHSALSTPFGAVDSLDALVRAASEVPVPGAEEERRLAEAARRGDTEARDQLLRAHVRIVVDEAIRYRDAARDATELVADGLAALHDALLRFDPSAHGRFGGYARDWIRLRIRDVPRA